MPFQIIRNDITRVKADAIVNTANPEPKIGRGTDTAIYEAAGAEKLLEARQKIGPIDRGQSAYTEAFDLDAKYIIHTVGPVWRDGLSGERAILRSCYETSLELADQLKCRSVAFPLISSGAYGFPKDEALTIASDAIRKFLLTHEMKVLLVVFDRKALELSEKLVGEIEQFIDEQSAHKIRESEYKGYHLSSVFNRRNRRRPGHEAEESRHRPDDEVEKNQPAEKWQPEEVLLPAKGKSLDEILDDTGETFQQRLFKLIDASGMSDVTVYKKANIDRKLFSRIRCKPDYKPKKKTAVAFAIALELDLPTMLDLLARAEIALSPSNKLDLIVTYFVTHKNYDIYEINMALFHYGQPALGE